MKELQSNTALLSSQQAAKLLCISESTVKRLCDMGQLSLIRTPGGHRRISRKSIEAYLENRSMSSLVAEPSQGSEHPSDLNFEELLDCLLSHQYEQPFSLFESVRFAQGIVALVDSVLGPLLELVGDRWEQGVLSVHQEHLISERIRHYLEIASRRTPTHSNTVKRAIGSAPALDLASIPSKLIELVLRDHGWNASSLGANLPASELAAAARRENASLVWVSYCHDSLDDLIYAENQILRRGLPDSTRLVIGGRALTATARRLCSFDFAGDSLQHLVNYTSRAFDGKE